MFHFASYSSVGISLVFSFSTKKKRNERKSLARPDAQAWWFFGLTQRFQDWQLNELHLHPLSMWAKLKGVKNSANSLSLWTGKYFVNTTERILLGFCFLYWGDTEIALATACHALLSVFQQSSLKWERAIIYSFCSQACFPSALLPRRLSKATRISQSLTRKPCVVFSAVLNELRGLDGHFDVSWSSVLAC